MLGISQWHRAGQNMGSKGNNKEYIRMKFSKNITSVKKKKNHRREMADFQKDKAPSGELDDPGQNSKNKLWVSTSGNNDH